MSFGEAGPPRTRRVPRRSRRMRPDWPAVPDQLAGRQPFVVVMNAPAGPRERWRILAGKGSAGLRENPAGPEDWWSW